MRNLTGHQVNECNEQLEITVVDEKGQGGACHHYRVEGFDLVGNPANCPDLYNKHQIDIVFQNGPIKECGVNGITHEALLAILIDRMECFQAGEYANTFNDGALRYFRAAQDLLQSRTKDRVDRGVEGTHEK